MKITYETKVGIVPRTVHINQVWDIDMNELRTVINFNDDQRELLADRVFTLENTKLNSVVAGTNIVIDNSNPLSPVISSIGAVTPEQIDYWDNKLNDVNAGSGITINKTNPLEPLISAIPQTSAGVYLYSYFTGQITTTPAGTFYDALILDKGNVASVVRTVNSDGLLMWFTNDFLSPVTTELVEYKAGDYSGVISVETSNTTEKAEFILEYYIADVDGNVIDSGIVGAPVGSLGVKVVSILTTGTTDLPNNEEVQRSFSGIVISNFSISPNQRFRTRIGAKKIGSAGNPVTLTNYTGFNHIGYLSIPVPMNTDTVLNKSNVIGATASDALNSLKSQIETTDLQKVTDVGNSTTNPLIVTSPTIETLHNPGSLKASNKTTGKFLNIVFPLNTIDGNITFPKDKFGEVALISDIPNVPVLSVFGRTGNVIANVNDYNTFYLGISATAVDSNRLGNQLPAYYLDYNNFTNKPILPQTKNVVANQYFNSYNSTTGLFTTKQVAYSEISGTPAIPTPADYVPYIGATADLNLGARNFIQTGKNGAREYRCKPLIGDVNFVIADWNTTRMLENGDYQVFASNSKVYLFDGSVSANNPIAAFGLTTDTALSNNNAQVPKGYVRLSKDRNEIWLIAQSAADGASQINSRLQIGYNSFLPDQANTNILDVNGNIVSQVTVAQIDSGSVKTVTTKEWVLTKLPTTKAKLLKQYLDSYDATTGLFTSSQVAYSDLTGIPNLSNVAYKNVDNNFTVGQTINGYVNVPNVFAIGYVENTPRIENVFGSIVFFNQSTENLFELNLTSRDAFFYGNVRLFTGKTITSASFIKSGGTALQFLKADGSIDSNTYLTSASLANVAYKNVENIFTSNQTIENTSPRLTLSETDTGNNWMWIVDGSSLSARYNGTGGSKFVISSSGYVGIGSGGSPTEALDVTGNGKFTGNVTTAELISTGNIRLNSQIKFGNFTGDNARIAYTGGNFYLDNFAGFWDFRTTSGYASRLRITNGGNVGIGTTEPQNTFHAYFNNTSSASKGAYFGDSTNGYLRFYNNSSNLFAPTLQGYTSSANTSPVSLIAQAIATSTVSAFRFSARRSGATTIGSTDIAFQIDNYTTNLVTVLGNGNVLIGTTTNDTVNKLQVNGSGTMIGATVLNVGATSTEALSILANAGGGALSATVNSRASLALKVTGGSSGYTAITYFDTEFGNNYTGSEFVLSTRAVNFGVKTERFRIDYLGAATFASSVNVTSDLTVGGNIKANGIYYYGDDKIMFQFSDTWLRINGSGNFTTGIYCGSSLLRTDGNIQVGASGNVMLYNTGNGVFSGSVTANKGIFNKPATFWANESYYGVNGFGQVSTEGGFQMCITSNGYRNTSGTWTSHAINGNTGASQIALSPDGNIYFRGDSIKSNGSSSSPNVRMTLSPTGNLTVTGNVTSGDILTGKKLITTGRYESPGPWARYSHFTPTVDGTVLSGTESIHILNVQGYIQTSTVNREIKVNINIEQLAGSIPVPIFSMQNGNQNVRLVGLDAANGGYSQINSKLQVGYSQLLPNESSPYALSVSGTGLFTGNLTANAFVKSGGTSSQYLMADGSVSTGVTAPIIATTSSYSGTYPGLSVRMLRVSRYGQSMTMNIKMDAPSLGSAGDIFFRIIDSQFWPTYTTYFTMIGNSASGNSVVTYFYVDNQGYCKMDSRSDAFTDGQATVCWIKT